MWPQKAQKGTFCDRVVNATRGFPALQLLEASAENGFVGRKGRNRQRCHRSNSRHCLKTTCRIGRNYKFLYGLNLRVDPAGLPSSG